MTNFQRLPKLLWDAFKQAIYGSPGLSREESGLLPGRNSFGHCPYCGERIGSRSSSQIHLCYHCNRVFLVKAFYQSKQGNGYYYHKLIRNAQKQMFRGLHNWMNCGWVK
jgi:ribosomal protein L37AE/L43A